MKHRPKFSDLCQCIVNACQAAEPINGASVTLNLEAANNLARALPPREFQIFDIQQTGRDAFAVRLRGDQPSPPTPTT